MKDQNPLQRIVRFTLNRLNRLAQYPHRQLLDSYHLLSQRLKIEVSAFYEFIQKHPNSFRRIQKTKFFGLGMLFGYHWYLQLYFEEPLWPLNPRYRDLSLTYL
jgi:hypothetical protein